jgi:hypothetical protein
MTTSPLNLVQHYKGDLYIVTAISDDSTNGSTNELYVTYFSLKKKTYHVRLFDEFFDTVLDDNGKRVQRFRYVTEPGDIKVPF